MEAIEDMEDTEDLERGRLRLLLQLRLKLLLRLTDMEDMEASGDMVAMEDTEYLERGRLRLLLQLRLKLLLRLTDMEVIEAMVDTEEDMEDMEDTLDTGAKFLMGDVPENLVNLLFENVTEINSSNCTFSCYITFTAALSIVLDWLDLKLY